MGWTTRLGLLVPSANAVMEHDAQLLLPVDVSLHSARMPLTRDDEDQIEALAAYAPSAAKTLVDADVDVIGFGCTTGSLLKGSAYDQEIIGTLAEFSGVPVTTTSTAVVEALRVLGVSRLLLLSPYPSWLQERVVTFLTAHGSTVKAEYCWQRPDPRDIEAVTPDEIVDEAMGRAPADIEAVFVSCTGFRGMEAVTQIEAKLGLPVVTSNQATLWHMLRLAGKPLKTNNFGRLFTIDAPPTNGSGRAHAPNQED